MRSGLISADRTGVERAVIRWLVIICLTAMLAMTLLLAQAQPVFAARSAATPSTSTSVHQDRRPDRERPVSTSQSSSGSGFSQNSSSNNSRPRLVRR